MKGVGGEIRWECIDGLEVPRYTNISLVLCDCDMPVF